MFYIFIIFTWCFYYILGCGGRCYVLVMFCLVWAASQVSTDEVPDIQKIIITIIACFTQCYIILEILHYWYSSSSHSDLWQKAHFAGCWQFLIMLLSSRLECGVWFQAFPGNLYNNVSVYSNIHILQTCYVMYLFSERQL